MLVIRVKWPIAKKLEPRVALRLGPLSPASHAGELYRIIASQDLYRSGTTNDLPLVESYYYTNNKVRLIRLDYSTASRRRRGISNLFLAHSIVISPGPRPERHMQLSLHIPSFLKLALYFQQSLTFKYGN